MELLKLLLRQTGSGRNKLILFSALAGLSNVLLLAILNIAAEDAVHRIRGFGLPVIFTLVASISVLSQKFVWRNANEAAEAVVHDIRTRIMRKVASCGLEALERVGPAELHAAVRQHTYTITISAPPLVISLQNVLVVVFTGLYLAILSLPAFVVAACAIGVALANSVRQARKMNALFDKSLAAEQKMHGALSDLLDGFKEVKLNKLRETELMSEANVLSIGARDSRIETGMAMAGSFIGMQTGLYFLLAALVFLVPQFSAAAAYSEIAVKITTAGLFVLGPITGIFAIMPALTHADVAIAAIRRTEARLDAERDEGETPTDAVLPSVERFASLAMDEVTFVYTSAAEGERSFSIGPLSFAVRAGEIVFVTGGNGSGKTTMLRVLLGLYTPVTGVVRVNGEPVSELGNLRSLFATVLSDYHLFSRAYGIAAPDRKRVDELLARMGLAGKTSWQDGGFTTLNLSSGQRKRLALIVAILEDRPIVVFDEWAADQDPNFRRIFYEEILPDLRAAGKTVIAVTHDDRYFAYADRHLHMAEGQIAELTQGGQATYGN
jgi:putative ATP-binding cassette transporter